MNMQIIKKIQKLGVVTMNRIFKILLLALVGASLSSCFLFPSTVGYTEDCSGDDCEYHYYSH